jgi:hypothetical protein
MAAMATSVTQEIEHGLRLLTPYTPPSNPVVRNTVVRNEVTGTKESLSANTGSVASKDDADAVSESKAPGAVKSNGSKPAEELKRKPSMFKLMDSADYLSAYQAEYRRRLRSRVPVRVAQDVLSDEETETEDENEADHISSPLKSFSMVGSMMAVGKAVSMRRKTQMRRQKRQHVLGRLLRMLLHLMMECSAVLSTAGTVDTAGVNQRTSKSTDPPDRTSTPLAGSPYTFKTNDLDPVMFSPVSPTLDLDNSLSSLGGASIGSGDLKSKETRALKVAGSTVQRRAEELLLLLGRARDVVTALSLKSVSGLHAIEWVSQMRSAVYVRIFQYASQSSM